MDVDQQADRLLGADLLERRGTVGEVASTGTAGGLRPAPGDRQLVVGGVQPAVGGIERQRVRQGSRR